MTVGDFRNLVAVFPVPGQHGFHMAHNRRNTKLITDSEKHNMRAWVWVSAEAFVDAPLLFGPLADFFADAGADELEFVKEIHGMSEARKARKRFHSTELMASTGWFPPFPPNPEGLQQAEGVPSTASSPSSTDLSGTCGWFWLRPLLVRALIFVVFVASSIRATARARLARSSRDSKSLAAIHSRIATWNGKENSDASYLGGSGPRASLKRPSSLALSDAPSDPKRANLMIEAEAVEVRGECSQGLAESPLKIWKGIVTSCDVEYFFVTASLTHIG